jgi:hypothetical protein
VAYLSDSDIRDRAIVRFKDSDTTYWAALKTKADAAIVDLAEAIGVSSEFIKTPLHNTIMDYGIAYFCKMACMDHANINATEGTEDKWRVKLEIYASEEARLRQRITSEMFVGTVSDRGDRTVSSILYRG